MFAFLFDCVLLLTATYLSCLGDRRHVDIRMTQGFQGVLVTEQFGVKPLGFSFKIASSSNGVTYLNVNIVTAGGWFLGSSFILFWGTEL